MKNHAFFGFSKYLHLVPFLVKKIFAFRYLFTNHVFVVQQNAAIRIRVAERQWRHTPNGRGDKKIRAFSHFSRAVSQSRAKA